VANRDIPRAWFCIVGLAAVGCLAANPTSTLAQGDYAPVTAKDVVAMKLNHYFTADKKSHVPDFEWTFTEKEFVIKKGKGPIPADLLEQLLPKDMKADEIRGEWKIDKKDPLLVLTKIKVGGEKEKKKKEGLKEAVFPIYRSAPIVIRIGEPQFVFGLDWRKKRTAITALP
jgi:hypothetical protein